MTIARYKSTRLLLSGCRRGLPNDLNELQSMDDRMLADIAEMTSSVAANGRSTMTPKLRSRIEIRPDDLLGAATRQLVARHLRGMHESSPPESVHALDIDALRDPSVTFWSVWLGEEIVGCGALKAIDAERGEIKSMRVADAFLGQGIGRALLDHIIAEARARGMRSLWLETGAPAAFLPAIRLYESAGFARCGPFDGYIDDPFCIFMTRTI